MEKSGKWLFCVFVMTFFIKLLYGNGLPSGSILYEAEEFMEPQLGKIKENSDCSGGRYVSWPRGKNYLHLLKFPSPEDKNTKYAIWIRHKGCSICLKNSEAREITWLWYKAPVWKWNKFGEFTSSELGENFIIMTSPHFDEGVTEGGIDCVILSPSPSFTPEGIYSKKTESEQMTEESSLKKANVVELNIDFSSKNGKVSPYIASANLNQNHLLDNKEWDSMMREFFGGGFLRIQVSMFKEPDRDGNWWNFKEIDLLIKTAREKWGVEKLLIAPSAILPGWDYNSKITEEQISKTTDAIMQIAKRYGSPGNVLVEYWEPANEWWGGYWEKNPEEFLRIYTHFCKLIKDINPDLKVGGPVDAWPTIQRIEGLLRSFPDIDFISWHMYPTGSAGPVQGVFSELATLYEKMFDAARDYKEALFSRAYNFYTNVIASQKISEKILGKKLPVIISEYHINYRAWDPPDPMMCIPLGGVWNALVLVYLSQSDCFAGMIHDVRAVHYGLFGPNDGLSSHFKIIPPPTGEEIYIRPTGHIHYFFIKHIAGKEKVSLTKKGASSNFEAIAVTDDKERSIVMINFSSEQKQVKVHLSGVSPKSSSGFSFPVNFLFCDANSIFKGDGIFFNTEGDGIFTIHPYSVWCLNF